MITASSISKEEQDVLLEKKLEERTNYSLLTDPDTNPNGYIEAQAVFYDLCKNSCNFFIDNCLWIQNPKAKLQKDKEFPFLLWNYQDIAVNEIVKAIDGGYDLPVEKCREVGATWLVLAVFYWGWHFHRWELLIGGKKAEDCDKKGDIGSLFEKLRFMISRTPQFVFPKQLDKFSDKMMLLIHPQHGASISGEGNSNGFGRSDRRKAIFFDEFSSWESTEKAAYDGCDSTTDCRLAVSTPNWRGTNCYFYDVVQETKKNNKPILVIPWTVHPVFADGIRPTTDDDLAFKKYLLKETSPWLENKIIRSTSISSVAQEILIDYQASMSGVVFPEWDNTIQISDDIEYDYNLPLYVSWDFGLDSTAMVFIQPYKNSFRVIDEYVNNGNDEGASIYHYLDVLDSKDYKMAIHYGDPFSGENRSITSGLSPASILRKHGITFKCKRARIANRIQAARAIVPRLVVSSKCTLFIDMMENWQMKKPKSGATGGMVPDHSQHSHIGEAFSYFAYNYSGSSVSKNHERRKLFSPSASGVTL